VDLKHKVIQEFKRLAQDHGLPVTRQKFRIHSEISERQLKNAFPGSPTPFTDALKAAGFTPSPRASKKPKPSAEEIFGKPIREVLQRAPEEFTQKVKEGFKRTVFIGDAHFPFVNQNALTAVYEYLERHKPARVVQMGDLYDMFSHGKFPRSRHIYNPVEEINYGFEMAKEMWATIRKIIPGVECHQILGNHDVRPLKRIIEQYPEGEPFFSIDKYFQFEGVTTHMDTRSPVDFGEFIVLHGIFSKLGDHVSYFHRNCVVGHSHRAGLVFKVLGGSLSMNSTPDTSATRDPRPWDTHRLKKPAGRLHWLILMKTVPGP
jgi:hypothetical protein